MPLFILRREHNPERVYWESNGHVRANLVYAFHLTREITEEEWKKIVERAEKRYKVEWARFWEISDQVNEALQGEGVKISNPQWLPRSEKRLKELGVIPFGMWKSLGEVLAEEGFTVLEPKELTYQVPLTDWEKQRIADQAAFEEGIRRERETAPTP